MILYIINLYYMYYRASHATICYTTKIYIHLRVRCSSMSHLTKSRQCPTLLRSVVSVTFTMPSTISTRMAAMHAASCRLWATIILPFFCLSLVYCYLAGIR